MSANKEKAAGTSEVNAATVIDVDDHFNTFNSSLKPLVKSTNLSRIRQPRHISKVIEVVLLDLHLKFNLNDCKTLLGGYQQ